jgi:hypothetical protein
MAKQFTVLLRDRITPSWSEKVVLEVKEGEKVADSAKRYMDGYCERGDRKPYIEEHEKEGKHLRACFVDATDFYLMWFYTPKVKV